MLEKLLRSKAEAKVLGVVLFSDGLHLREISRRAGVSPFETRRELQNLASLGLLKRQKKANALFFYLNKDCAFLDCLKELHLKTEGVIPALKKEFGKIKGIKYVFIYGSFARGTFSEKSDVDLLIIGEVGEGAINEVCLDLQGKYAREINYIIWSEGDLNKKLREKTAFLGAILKNKKIWLCGDEDEFERNVAKA